MLIWNPGSGWDYARSADDPQGCDTLAAEAAGSVDIEAATDTCLVVARPHLRSFLAPCTAATCISCSHRSQGKDDLLAVTEADLPRVFPEAGYHQLCNGCGEEMFGKRIAKAHGNSFWQCIGCALGSAQEFKAEKLRVEVIGRLNTEEQEKIIHFVKWAKGSAIIDAKAGSGKTTTICRCYWHTVKAKMSSLFIAFNNAIVVELRRRGMPSSTAHAVGWRAWRKAHPEWWHESNGSKTHRSRQQEFSAAVADSSSDSDSSGWERGAKRRRKNSSAATWEETSGQAAAYGPCKNKTTQLLAELYPYIAQGAGEKQHCLKKHRFSKPLARFVRKLVSMAKNHGVGVAGCMAEEPSTWEWLIEHYNLAQLLLDPEKGFKPEVKVSDATEYAREVLQASIKSAQTSPEDGGLFDFDDMLYMPLREGLSFPKYDMVYVDEAQDMNLARMGLLSELLHEKSRVLAVGDPFQAIFGFTGARHDSLGELRSRLQAVTFPLSITWRCPVLHVELANLLLRRLRESGCASDGEDVCGMKAANGAVQGSIAGRWWSWAGMHRNEEVTFANYPVTGSHDVAVLCRMNAPLLLLHYKFLARGVPSQLKGGKEAAGELINFAWEAMDYFEHAGEATCVTLKIALAKYAATAQKRKVSPARQEQEQDLSQCLAIMIEKVGNEAPMKALASALLSVFAPQAKSKGSGGSSGSDRRPVQLSTVHKAKGLEWHTVYILQPFTLPLPNIVDPDGRTKENVQDWERQQEFNVTYVAVTRACRELLFLKYVKKLRDNPHKIVEVFGEEEAGSARDEEWWDEQERRHGSSFGEDQRFAADPDMTAESAAKVLGVKHPGASAADIKSAYKKGALRSHPDKVSEEKRKNYTKLFQKLKAAHDLLLQRLAA